MGKVFAILGDIHSNLEALTVVLDDCRKQGVTDYLCTGDVIGYNASPRECMKIVRELGCPVVKGNHDHYVSSVQNLNDFQPHAALVIKWTRSQLDDEQLEWLQNLPYTVTAMGITIVHSTNDTPGKFGYVFDNLQAEANFTHQKAPICFHGHTHCPMIYEKSMNGVFRIDPVELPNGEMKLPLGRKYFINVGSVGQPRDGDPRAAYVIYDVAQRLVRFRRLPYDIAGAQQKILEAGLPDRLAERLQFGQ